MALTEIDNATALLEVRRRLKDDVWAVLPRLADAVQGVTLLLEAQEGDHPEDNPGAAILHLVHEKLMALTEIVEELGDV